MEFTLDDINVESFPEISQALTAFDPNSIGDSLQKQATVYSYCYSLMAQAKRQLDDLERSKTRLAAVLRSGHRTSHTGSKKLTAKDLDDLVDADDSYIQCLTDVTDAELIYELLKGLVRALEQKKDMLIQASSNQRAEAKLYN